MSTAASNAVAVPPMVVPPVPKAEDVHVAAKREELERQRAEQRAKDIRDLRGRTPIEQQLIDVMRTMLALPPATPISALREIARAAIDGVRARKLRERHAHVTLRSIAETPLDAAKTDDARAFIERTLLRLARSSVRVLTVVTEHVERQLAPSVVEPRAVFARCSIELAIRVAQQRHFAVPVGDVPEQEHIIAAWRAFWLAMLDYEERTARDEAAEMPSPPRFVPVHRSGGGDPL